MLIVFYRFFTRSNPRIAFEMSPDIRAQSQKTLAEMIEQARNAVRKNASSPPDGC